MKKLGSIFLGILLFVPSFSFAQKATTSTSTLTWSQKQSLIATLMQELQVLETAIAAIIAQQAQQASTTQQIISTQQIQSQEIQQISQNTQTTNLEASQPQFKVVPILSSILVAPAAWFSSQPESDFVSGGNCGQTDMYFQEDDQNGVPLSTDDFVPIAVSNPETGISLVGTMQEQNYGSPYGIELFQYTPQATSTTEIVNYSAANLTGTFTVNVGQTVYQWDEENAPSRLNFSDPRWITDLTTGDRISNTTQMCL